MTASLRTAIQRAGGIATLGDLAKRWGVTRQRAHELSDHPEFPESVATVSDGKTELYAIGEADAWRARPRPKGRPRGRTNAGLGADGLAVELGIHGKTLRQWLRDTFEEDAPGRGRVWELTTKHVEAARVRWPGN